VSVAPGHGALEHPEDRPPRSTAPLIQRVLPLERAITCAASIGVGTITVCRSCARVRYPSSQTSGAEGKASRWLWRILTLCRFRAILGV